jgi:hypothetical protein
VVFQHRQAATVKRAENVSMESEKYFDRNGKELWDEFENEPSATPLAMSEEDLAEFEERMERLLAETPKRD